MENEPHLSPSGVRPCWWCHTNVGITRENIAYGIPWSLVRQKDGRSYYRPKYTKKTWNKRNVNQSPGLDSRENIQTINDWLFHLLSCTENRYNLRCNVDPLDERKLRHNFIFDCHKGKSYNRNFVLLWIHSTSFRTRHKAIRLLN